MLPYLPNLEVLKLSEVDFTFPIQLLKLRRLDVSKVKISGWENLYCPKLEALKASFDGMVSFAISKS